MKPPLAIFCPLPPVKSGTADYCLEQLPHLARDWSLTVVVEKHAARSIPVPAGVETIDLRDWKRDRIRDRDTPRLYHLANNIHHEYVLEETLRRPGIMLVHDIVQHHLIVEMTLARGDTKRYREFMTHDFGELGTAAARQRERYIFSDYQQFLMPLNLRPLANALGVIAHSRWAERRIRQARPEIPVRWVPHHYSPPPPDALADSRTEARRRMGMPTDKLIFMVLGFATPPKRIDLTIRALAAIRDRLPPFEFWIVGELRDPVRLGGLLGECDMIDQTQSMGFVPLDRFQLAIQASDVVVNLRYPTAGESSGTLMRALGMGRPAVVFDYASFADFPDHVAKKVLLDTATTAPLEQALLELGTSAARRDRYSANASAWVRANCSLEYCTERITRLITESVGLSSLAS